MRIIGLNFTKISAERFKIIDGEMQISSNIEFESIDEEDVPVLEGDVLSFSFKYSLSYDPSYSLIEFKGKILVIIDEKDKLTKKEIIKGWGKKEINNELRLGLLNFIMVKGNVRALQFEEDLNLPYHLPMPKLEIKTEEDKSKD